MGLPAPRGSAWSGARAATELSSVGWVGREREGGRAGGSGGAPLVFVQIFILGGLGEEEAVRGGR